MKKLLAYGLIATLGLSTLASCGKDETVYNTEYDSYLVESGTLTIGCSTDFAPMEFIDTTKSGQDRFVGADISFGKYVAEKLGLKLEVKAMSFDVILTALDNNTIDMALSGFSWTEERASSYLSTECYYDDGDGGQVLLIKKTDDEAYNKIVDLNSSTKIVGAQTGSLQHTLIKENLPNAQKVTFANIDDAIISLQNGTYDAIACSKNTAEIKVESDSTLAIVEEEFDATKYEGNYAWVKKTNTELKNLVDDVIKEVSEQSLFETWVEQAKTLYLNLGDAAGEIIPEDDETSA